MHLAKEPRQREVGWKCSSCLLGVGKERGKVNKYTAWVVGQRDLGRGNLSSYPLCSPNEGGRGGLH